MAAISILVVDDERAIRNSLKEILEYENYKVEVAENGADGLQKVQNGKFDLIFLDLHDKAPVNLNDIKRKLLYDTDR